jgi:hypothetical protein
MCGIVADTIKTGAQSAPTELARQMAGELAEPHHPRSDALLPKLQAILEGARDPAVADDPELCCEDVVELRLLLESLGEA